MLAAKSAWYEKAIVKLEAKLDDKGHAYAAYVKCIIERYEDKIDANTGRFEQRLERIRHRIEELDCDDGHGNGEPPVDPVDEPDVITVDNGRVSTDGVPISTGIMAMTGFGREDRVRSSKPLFDGNGDGRLFFNRNGEFDFDGSDQNVFTIDFNGEFDAVFSALDEAGIPEDIFNYVPKTDVSDGPLTYVLAEDVVGNFSVDGFAGQDRFLADDVNSVFGTSAGAVVSLNDGAVIVLFEDVASLMVAKKGDQTLIMAG